MYDAEVPGDVQSKPGEPQGGQASQVLVLAGEDEPLRPWLHLGRIISEAVRS